MIKRRLKYYGCLSFQKRPYTYARSVILFLCLRSLQQRFTKYFNFIITSSYLITAENLKRIEDFAPATNFGSHRNTIGS